MLDSGPERPLRLIVGESHFDLSEREGERDTFLRLKSLFDGRHSAARIADLVGIPVGDVLATVEQFEALGLLRRETPTPSVPVADLRARLRATLTMWRNQIGFHPLFQDLAAGRADRRALLGLFIETYHVVRFAGRHIGVAISHADTYESQMALCRYLADEYDHAAFMKQTCVNLGCDGGEVERSHPIIGTLSLVQMLCEIGRTDTLAYFAALALFEALPQDAEAGEASIAQIAAAYAIDPAAFEPALDHLRGDLAAGHNSLLDAALDRCADLPADRVHRIVNMLHDLKHTYDQLHDGILKYYSDISNYVPRLKVDYFSL